MAIKCHVKRCYVRLSQDLHVENSARKRASKFQLTVDSVFDQVVNMIVDQHGQNWLCNLIQKSFKEIYQNPSKFKSKIHSIEIWQDDKLVAGELGYCCGPIYTSLTGAFIQDGAGTVQLITLGRLLEQTGFQIWDFGMSLPYKVNLGGKIVERKEWLDLYASLRDIPTPELKIDEKVSARFIVDFNHIVAEPEKKPKSDTPKQPKPKSDTPKQPKSDTPKQPKPKSDIPRQPKSDTPKQPKPKSDIPRQPKPKSDTPKQPKPDAKKRSREEKPPSKTDSNEKNLSQTIESHPGSISLPQ